VVTPAKRQSKMLAWLSLLMVVKPVAAAGEGKRVVCAPCGAHQACSTVCAAWNVSRVQCACGVCGYVRRVNCCVNQWRTLSNTPRGRRNSDPVFQREGRSCPAESRHANAMPLTWYRVLGMPAQDVFVHMKGSGGGSKPLGLDSARLRPRTPRPAMSSTTNRIYGSVREREAGTQCTRCVTKQPIR